MHEIKGVGTLKFKDYYDEKYVREFGEKLAGARAGFDVKAFCGAVKGKLDDKELFPRLDCITDAMEAALGDDYGKNIGTLFDILGDELPRAEGMFTYGWWLWPAGRYVERHGNEDRALSLEFLRELTKRFTGEYAIRPLLKENPAEVMDELILWTRDESVHVRRLASEGVRTRLPWSPKLYAALEEFERYTEILTNLKDDPEKFVQKSVGNNLNDLFKDAPEKAEFIIEKWRASGSSKAQEWIIKHGMRNRK